MVTGLHLHCTGAPLGHQASTKERTSAFGPESARGRRPVACPYDGFTGMHPLSGARRVMCTVAHRKRPGTGSKTNRVSHSPRLITSPKNIISVWVVVNHIRLIQNDLTRYTQSLIPGISLLLISLFGWQNGVYIPKSEQDILITREDAWSRLLDESSSRSSRFCVLLIYVLPALKMVTGPSLWDLARQFFFRVL
jgi:hypothetical protein